MYKSMNWCLVHIFLSIFLLCVSVPSETSFDYTKVKRKTPIHSLSKGFDDPKIAAVVEGMVLGNKTNVPRAYKDKFKSLGIMHLLTPSGLHISSLIVFFTPLFFFLKKLSRKKRLILELIVTLLFYVTTNFHSAKRILILRNCFKLKKMNVPHYAIFLLTFAIDFIFGGYHRSPLSFAFSFVFLGGIMASIGKGKFHFFAMLMIGQVMVNAFLGEEFSFIGSVMGMAITSMFTMVFPIIVMTYVITPLHFILEFLMQVMLTVIFYCSDLAVSFGMIEMSKYATILLPLFYVRKISYQLKCSTLAALFLFLPVIPEATKITGGKGNKIGTEIKRTRAGFIWRDQYGRKCSVKLKEKNFYELCN